eukprot:6287979-Amphidinium_carterae.1
MHWEERKHSKWRGPRQRHRHNAEPEALDPPSISEGTPLTICYVNCAHREQVALSYMLTSTRTWTEHSMGDLRGAYRCLDDTVLVQIYFSNAAGAAKCEAVQSRVPTAVKLLQVVMLAVGSC